MAAKAHGNLFTGGGYVVPATGYGIVAARRMDITATLTAHIAALMVAVGLWIGVGWHVMRHAVGELVQPTLAPSLWVGLGIWEIIWLLVVPLGGGHTIAAAGVYVLLMFLVMVPTLRDWARQRDTDEHFYTLLLLHGAMLAPWLLAVPLVQATTVGDFGFLNLLQQWDGLGRWPITEAEMGILAGQAGDVGAWLPLLMPLVAVKVGVGLPVAWNVLMAVVAAGTVGRLGVAPVRWSNALWVAATSLLGLMLVVAAWWPASWVEPMALVPLMVVVCAVAPLTAAGVLPVGFGALPVAVMLGFLVTLHPLALGVVAVVALGWFVRGCWQHGLTAGVVLAVSLLVCWPLLVLALVMQVGLMPSFAACWAPEALGQMVMCGLDITYPYLPATMGLRVAQLGGAMVLPWSVVAIQRVYTGSWLAGVAYRRPWLLGMVLGVPLMAFAMATAPFIRPEAPPVVLHAAEVVRDIQAKQVVTGAAKLAVQGVPEVAQAALTYGVGVPSVVLPDTLNLAQLHGTAMTNGISHVWQGPLAVRQGMGVSGTVDVSVLYEVRADAMVVRGLYPLPTSE